MIYNKEYLDLQYLLTKNFLIDIDKNILDISCSILKDEIIVQVVILKGTDPKINKTDKIHTFKITVQVVEMDKNGFNNNKGNWTIKGYNWLDQVLFSKDEVI
jgi:hypothetical protein